MTSTGRPRSRHLRWQVGLAVLATLGAICAATGEWLAREHASAARATAGDHLLRTADEMADRLSQEMVARSRDVQALADAGVLQSGPPQRAALEALQARFPQFAWIGVTDPAGTVQAATGGLLEGVSIAARPVFRNGREGLWTGDVHEAVLLAKLLPHPPGEDVKFVDVAAPLRRPDGTLAGVLATHLSWQWAEQLRQTVVRPRGAASSLQLMIVAADGTAVLPPEKAPPGLAPPPAAVTALTDTWGVARWNDGRDALTAVAVSGALGEFTGFGWRVVVRDLRAAEATSVAAFRPEAWGWSFGVGAVVAVVALGAVGRRWPRPSRGAPLPAGGVSTAAVRAHRRTDATVSTRPQTLPPPISPEAEADAALRDGLTGLGNSAALAALVTRLPLARAAEPQEACVLAIDLDGFEAINERYGRAAGDQVLAQVGRRLRQAARQGDNVFRLGGDDFLVVLTCPVGEATALVRAVAARVLNDLQRPLSYRTLTNVRISASVGGAVWPHHGEAVEEALGHAREALQAAKQSGPGKFRLYAGAGEASRLDA